jgi:hypothetical protein
MEESEYSLVWKKKSHCPDLDDEIRQTRYQNAQEQAGQSPKNKYPRTRWVVSTKHERLQRATHQPSDHSISMGITIVNHRSNFSHRHRHQDHEQIPLDYVINPYPIKEPGCHQYHSDYSSQSG